MQTDSPTLRDDEPDEGASINWWLSGGASLLLWTGVALLLTSA